MRIYEKINLSVSISLRIRNGGGGSQCEGASERCCLEMGGKSMEEGEDLIDLLYSF